MKIDDFVLFQLDYDTSNIIRLGRILERIDPITWLISYCAASTASYLMSITNYIGRVDIPVELYNLIKEFEITAHIESVMRGWIACENVLGLNKCKDSLIRDLCIKALNNDPQSTDLIRDVLKI